MENGHPQGACHICYDQSKRQVPGQFQYITKMVVLDSVWTTESSNLFRAICPRSEMARSRRVKI